MNCRSSSCTHAQGVGAYVTYHSVNDALDGGECVVPNSGHGQAVCQCGPDVYAPRLAVLHRTLHAGALLCLHTLEQRIV